MSDLVKIKILKNVGHYTEGQELEVTKEQADAICAPREKNDGYQVVTFHVAMRVEDIVKLQDRHVAEGGLSLDEARALGVHKPAVPPGGPGPLAPHLEVVPDMSEKASFTEQKSADEGKSAKLAMELNEQNAKRKAK